MFNTMAHISSFRLCYALEDVPSSILSSSNAKKKEVIINSLLLFPAYAVRVQKAAVLYVPNVRQLTESVYYGGEF